MEGAIGPRLGRFIEETFLSTECVEVESTLRRELLDLGYDYACCSVGNGPLEPGRDILAPVVMLDFPKSWQEHYIQNNYISIDPIVSRTPFVRRPFHWGQLTDLSVAQERLFQEARAAGLRTGIAVPIHGPDELFVASLVTSNPAVRPEDDLRLIHALITQFHVAWSSLRDNETTVSSVGLRGRERECLVWSARGKSSADIGLILNISDNTVNFHLKNAMAKLDASTRIMAIVKAIRLGLIVP